MNTQNNINMQNTSFDQQQYHSNHFQNQSRNVYDDGNIPEIDLPQGTQEFRQPKENWITTSPKSGSSDEKWITEPLPESTRPRQDGPGGENSK